MNELRRDISERRRMTRHSVYQYLYQAKEPRSKQEIARDLNLSPPTVHQNITELLDAGLICYGGVQQSTGGRRAKGFVIEAGARFAIGVSITGEYMRLVATDLRLKTIAYKKTKRMSHEQAREIGSVLYKEVERFLNENNLDRARMLGVGVAAPAVIDLQHENIILAPTLRLKELRIESILESIPYPCFVENDGTCAGHAEWFLQGEGRNFAYVSLEEGVGGAVLLEGTPYIGNNHRSGEFGHICVNPDGLLCNCGKRGCLEAYCSAQRISEDLGITLDTFFSRVHHGDAEACALWTDLLQHLAIGVNTIRMMLDCEVVLGGYLSQYLAPWLPELKKMAAELNTFEESGEYIHIGQDPRHAVVRGAALHFVEDFIAGI